MEPIQNTQQQDINNSPSGIDTKVTILENNGGLVPKIVNDIKNVEAKNKAARIAFWVSLGVITFIILYTWLFDFYNFSGYDFNFLYALTMFVSPFAVIFFIFSTITYFSTSVRLNSLRKKVALGNIGTELVSPSKPKSVGNVIGEIVGAAVLSVVVVFLIGFGLCMMMFSGF